MKTIKLIIFALSILVCASTVHAASWNDSFGAGNSGNSVFSMAGITHQVVVNVRSNTWYTVNSDSASGAPLINNIWVWPETGGRLSFWTATNTLTVASNGSAGDTAIWLVASNATGGDYTTLATNDVLVYKGANDVYQMVWLSGNATSSQGVTLTNALLQTKIKLWSALSNAPVAGDKIYKMAERFGVNPLTLGNVTNDIVVPWGGFWQIATRAAAFSYCGEIGEPTLVTLTHSNSATSGLFISGEYRRR